MRTFWYYYWLSSQDPVLSGSMVISSYNNEFPMKEVHVSLHNEYGHFCVISFWTQISENQYLEYCQYCKETGFGEMGRVLNPKDNVKVVDFKDPEK